jgi:fatty-acyl-CoA synthase
VELPNDDLSYDAGETDPSLLRQTIPQNLAETATRCPDRDALVHVPSGRRWTYAQLHRGVRALDTGLHRHGVRNGDRVGIRGPNTWEWVLVQYATAELGAVLVHINPAHRPHELA